METILQYIPAVLSAILLAVLILMRSEEHTSELQSP